MTDYECPDCEADLESVSNGWYCPDCTDSWSEDRLEELNKTWGDVDFPFWVEWESYDDTYGLARNVARQTDVPMDDIPSGDMKYTVFTVWFRIDEHGGVYGPYDRKAGEKL